MVDFLVPPRRCHGGLKSGRLAGLHKDPFDRMIVAQALADDIPVISIDAKLDFVWVWPAPRGRKSISNEPLPVKQSMPDLRTHRGLTQMTIRRTAKM